MVTHINANAEMIAENCEFGYCMSVYPAEERIKGIVHDAVFYGFQKGHTVVLSPCAYTAKEQIPYGHKYRHMLVDDLVYETTYTNVAPDNSQEKQLNMFEMFGVFV